jgi:hypothetical protein
MKKLTSNLAIIFTILILGISVNVNKVQSQNGQKGFAPGVSIDDRNCTTITETHWYVDGVYPYFHKIIIRKTICSSF